jgi:hypothetical protein
LIGRAAILGEQQNNDFVDVVCGSGNFQDMTYVIARSGILCEFNGRRLLDRWVNVKVRTFGKSSNITTTGVLFHGIGKCCRQVWPFVSQLAKSICLSVAPNP